MAVTNGAGIGTAQGQRVGAFLARLEEELLQFAAEEFRAARVGEGQGGQRIDDPCLAHHTPPAGFHADDADDDLRRHAVDARCPLQVGFVLVPEQHAVLYVTRRDELLPVAQPGAVRSAGWGIGRGLPVHQADHPVQALGLGEQVVQLLAVETVLADHPVDEALCRRIVRVIAAQRQYRLHRLAYGAG